MFYKYVSIGHVAYFVLSIQNNNGIICPKDGRWPHPADCEKFYTCNGGIGVAAWCGNGMAYDIDYGRCDLSRNIECKNGERPKRISSLQLLTEPENSPAIAAITSTVTPSSSHDDMKLDPSDRQTIKLLKSLSTKLTYGRILPTTEELMENHPCTFQGNRLDPNSCQSYFSCKEDIVTRNQCPDKHLFDEYLRSCNDYRKVVCGNRPIHHNKKDPCTGKPNGWYAEYGNQCRSYYLCTEQRKTKTGDCPKGSKWNPYRLLCDDPKYIPPPCGYRSNYSVSLFSLHSGYLTIFMTCSFFFVMF